MKQRRYITVIVPLKLEWEPCYYIPEEIAEVNVGDRVKVIFANKEYTRTVSTINFTPDISPEKILPITSLETVLEKITPGEIALWRMVSEYYLCSIGEVYKAAYPAKKVNLEAARASAMKTAADRRERLLEAMRLKVQNMQGNVEAKKARVMTFKEGTKGRAAQEESLERMMKQLESALKALTEAESDSNGKIIEDSISIWPESRISLTDAQQIAYNDIKKGFISGKPVMLHGVTGSGKTEIYIKLAQETLSEGRNVLMLVPEIALSRQLEDRIREHMGDRLMVFHSRETEASRRQTAEEVRKLNGTDGTYMILGTRSALFLPHHDLGLIIVDEEHDSSYKQDSPAPRYNGRDTALMLGTLNPGCRILMGSATPSLEEQYNCTAGRHTLVQLTQRYHVASDTDTVIIDTKAERRKNGMTGSLSKKLIAHIENALAEGGQVLILRARRAWATAMQCETCGEIVKCPHCNVSLSYHKTDGSMRCHYCGHTSRCSGLCRSCGGRLIGLGAGTQKIEEELSTTFPQARVARLDSDTAQSRNTETAIIREFSKGDIDILVGTQMITKGFDFSGLTLVAVIAADSFLGIQDFRADEKALQILEQFKGRCGRRSSKGTIVVQTSQPEHPVYRYLAGEARSGNAGFMLERKEFGFPPYTRIIEITLRDSNLGRISKMSSMLGQELRKKFSIGASILSDPVTGPYSPVIDRTEDENIRKIRLTLKKDKMLTANKKALAETINCFEKSYRYTGHITIDVDPS